MAEAEAVEEEASEVASEVALEAAEVAVEDLEPPAEEEDSAVEVALEEVSGLSFSANIYFQVVEEPTSEA